MQVVYSASFVSLFLIHLNCETVNFKHLKIIAKYVNPSCALPGAVSAGVVFGRWHKKGMGERHPGGRDTSAQLDHVLISTMILFPHNFDQGADDGGLHYTVDVQKAG